MLGTAKALNYIHGGRNANTIHAVAEIAQDSAPDSCVAMNEIFGGGGDDHITVLADGDSDGLGSVDIHFGARNDATRWMAAPTRSLMISLSMQAWIRSRTSIRAKTG